MRPCGARLREEWGWRKPQRRWLDVRPRQAGLRTGQGRRVGWRKVAQRGREGGGGGECAWVCGEEGERGGRREKKKKQMEKKIQR